jgi:hypothetical protein
MAPFGRYVDFKDMTIFNRLLTHNGGYAGPLKWYQSVMRGINAADEQGVLYPVMLQM